MRNNKSDYKYTIEEVREGEWSDYNSDRSLTYWHLIVSVNGDYKTSIEVKNALAIDLKPFLGEMPELTKHEVSVRAGKNISYGNDTLTRPPAFEYLPYWFYTKVYWRNGTWFADLHLLEEWHTEFHIKKDQD